MSKSVPLMTSRALEACSVSLVGPFVVLPNHSMFQPATSSVVADPFPGITTREAASGGVMPPSEFAPQAAKVKAVAAASNGTARRGRRSIIQAPCGLGTDAAPRVGCGAAERRTSITSYDGG